MERFKLIKEKKKDEEGEGDGFGCYILLRLPR